MTELSVTRDEFNSLIHKEIYDVHCREGLIMAIEDPEVKKIMALKLYYRQSRKIKENQQLTVQSLIEYRDVIDIEQFVMPEKVLLVDGKFIGFTMPLLDNVTPLKDVFSDHNRSASEKIDYLKQIGRILEKMQDIRANSPLKDFYLNDLHAGNFLIDEESNSHIIDLNSCKINNNKPSPTLYLHELSPIANYPGKYHQNPEMERDMYDFKMWGNYIPDRNTDIYCYIMSIIEMLYRENITIFSEKDFYTNVLQNLLEFGVSKELIEIFSLVYSNEDNINPGPYLDGLYPYLESKQKVYK